MQQDQQRAWIRASATGCALLLLAVGVHATPKPPLPEGAHELEYAVFAGGNFWNLEPLFDDLHGVVATTLGYSGGTGTDPNYQQVASGTTGHYEVVQVAFDPHLISYPQLLEVYWHNIDPFDGEGQFCDRGAQHTSAIFFQNDDQQVAAYESLEQLSAKRRVPERIATRILPAAPFYRAESYHQNFYLEHPKRYRFYRAGCRRDAKLEAIWQSKLNP